MREDIRIWISCDRKCCGRSFEILKIPEHGLGRNLKKTSKFVHTHLWIEQPYLPVLKNIQNFFLRVLIRHNHIFLFELHGKKWAAVSMEYFHSLDFWLSYHLFLPLFPHPFFIYLPRPVSPSAQTYNGKNSPLVMTFFTNLKLNDHILHILELNMSEAILLVLYTKHRTNPSVWKIYSYDWWSTPFRLNSLQVNCRQQARKAYSPISSSLVYLFAYFSLGTNNRINGHLTILRIKKKRNGNSVVFSIKFITLSTYDYECHSTFEHLDTFPSTYLVAFFYFSHQTMVFDNANDKAST